MVRECFSIRVGSSMKEIIRIMLSRDTAQFTTKVGESHTKDNFIMGYLMEKAKLLAKMAKCTKYNGSKD